MSTAAQEPRHDADSQGAIWYGLWPDGRGGAYWWFGGVGDDPVAGHVPAEALAGPLARLDAALPQPARGETLGQAVLRARQGALAEPALELALARDLGAALLPGQLLARLRRDINGTLPTLVVAPGFALSRVPIELLVTDPRTDQRLLELAVVRGGLSPATVYNRSREPQQPAPGSRPLRVIDPSPDGSRVFPGGDDDDALHRWWDRDANLVLATTDGLDTDRDRLGTLLRADPPPSRLLFFGHAVSGTVNRPANAGILLRDGLLTAADWLPAACRWPAPPRVAIIGCHSNDSHLAEQMGLVVAAANAGAHTITTTRWTLPTDTYAPGGEDSTATPTSDLALAIDTAHDTDQPLHELHDWQLQRLTAWRAGRLDAAPLLWAAPITYHAPTGRDTDG